MSAGFLFWQSGFFPWLTRIVIVSLLVILLILYFRKSKVISKIVNLSLVSVFVLYSLQIVFWAQITYKSWKNSKGLAKYFFPPYTNYYQILVGRKITAFFISITLALGLAFVFWIVFSILKKNLFDFNQLKLIFLGAFICSWPKMILYFGLALIIALLILISKKIKKVDLIPCFLISALVIFIFGDLISKWMGLKVLRLTL